MAIWPQQKRISYQCCGYSRETYLVFFLVIIVAAYVTMNNNALAAYLACCGEQVT